MKYTLKARHDIADQCDGYFDFCDIDPTSVSFIADSIGLHRRLAQLESGREAAGYSASDVSLRLLSYVNSVLDSDNILIFPFASTIAAFASQYSDDGETRRDAKTFFDKLYLSLREHAPAHEAKLTGFQQRVFRTYYCAARIMDVERELGWNVANTADMSLAALLELNMDVYINEVVDAAHVADLYPYAANLLLGNIAEAVGGICLEVGNPKVDQELAYKNVTGMVNVTATIANYTKPESSLLNPFLRQFEIAWAAFHRMSPEPAMKFLANYADNKDASFSVQPAFAEIAKKMVTDIDGLSPPPPAKKGKSVPSRPLTP